MFPHSKCIVSDALCSLFEPGAASIVGLRGQVEDMSAQGMRPNSVTCSIILKSLAGHSAHADIRRAMELLDDMSEEMDEVLFASVIEACVRIGQLDLLSAKLQQYPTAYFCRLNTSRKYTPIHYSTASV